MNLPANTITKLRRIMPGRPLTRSEAMTIAERQALTFVRLADITGPAVPDEIIAGLPTVSVHYDADLPVSGSTLWSGGLWHLTLSAQDGWTRQRFTLAHEFKHVLDHPFIDGLYGPPGHAETADRVERVCDYFAACLLMPRPMLKRSYTHGNQTIAGLAREFDVSRAAMTVRLRQTGLIDQPTRHARRYYRAASHSPLAA